MAKTGGNNITAAYDPRQIWAANVAPLVVAAREGAAHAARTASKERARARQESAWWRQRWVIITAAGLAAVGAAGGVYAALAGRRSPNSRHAATDTNLPTDATMSSDADLSLADQQQANGLKSTVESGRAKVADVARNMVHKLRGDEPDQLAPEAPRMPEPASAFGDESRNQLHPTEGGYHGQP